MSSSSTSPNRICGGCTACCKVPEIDVPELKKKAGVWCQHCEIGVGCRIYGSRPQVCRPYKCQWLLGMGTDEERPDKVGVVLDFLREGDNGMEFSTLQVFEVEEGRLTQPFVEKWTNEALRRNVLVAHLYLSGAKVIFVPEGLREQLGLSENELGAMP